MSAGMTIKIGADAHRPRSMAGSDGIAAAALKVLKKGVTGGIGIATRGMTLIRAADGITAAGPRSAIAECHSRRIHPGARQEQPGVAGSI